MGDCWKSVDLSWPGTVGLILMLTTLLFLAVSFGTSNWGLIDPTQPQPAFDEGFMGILQYCRDERCVRYLDDQFLDIATDLALVQKTRAIACLMIVAAIINFLAIVQLTFGIGRKGNAPVLRNVFLEMFFCGLLAMISISIWAQIIRDLNEARFIEEAYDFKVGYSFSLAVAAWLLSFLAGGVLMIESKSIVYAEVKNVQSGGAGFL